MRQFRRNVYVVGAGFSFDLGYPLTSGLLVGVWERLGKSARKRLEKVLSFHHPNLSLSRKISFPDIEQLLTEISVNEEMFEASRPTEGNFKQGELSAIRDELLYEVFAWFHEIFPSAINSPWLATFAQRLAKERAAVISFNWDLLLDHQLFATELSAAGYGLGLQLTDRPVLLKPHGSLNWYKSTRIEHVSAEKRATIFRGAAEADRVEAFLRPRQIVSPVGNRYIPLVVPPTFMKDFSSELFQTLWRRCTTLLSTAQNIYFLGYSLPSADMQAQFIFRCGFQNQIEGRLNQRGRRTKPTGPANVVVVNPDQAAARRIESLAGPNIKCAWISQRVCDWLRDEP